MNNPNIFSRFLPDLSKVFARFPVATAITVGLWAYVMALIAQGTTLNAWESSIGLVAAFLGAGFGHLLSEGRATSRTANLILAAVLGVACYAVYTFFRVFQSSEQFLFPGLALALFIAPFFRRRVEQGEIWLFGQRLALAALLALIVGAVFGAGLFALVASVEFLFGVSAPPNTSAYISSTAIFLIGPLYGLSLVPHDFDDEIDLADHRNTLLERGISVFVNYVIVPLVALYALVIHAYAVKIAVIGELPNGEIGTIVSLFAGASVAAWLISWPWRESGTWLLKTYARYWFWLIPVPAVLLSIAVARRIGDYGITPDRYGLGIVVAWVVILFAYLLFRRNRSDMRVVIGTMAALLIAGSFGPWGANGMTERDQFARLKAVMTDTGILKGDTLVLPPPAINAEAKQQMYSMIQALGDVNGLDRVIALLPEKDRPKQVATRYERWTGVNSLTEKLGVQNAWQPATYISFNARKPVDVQVPGNMRLMGPYSALGFGTSPLPDQPVVVKLENNVLKLSGSVLNQSIDVRALADQMQKATGKADADPVVAELPDGSKLVIYDGYGDTAAKDVLSNMTFWLLVKG